MALTANAFASDLDACSAAGMDDNLAKPESMEGLLATVARWSRIPGTEPGDVPAPPVRKTGFRPSATAQARYAEHRARTLEHVDALIRRGTFGEEELQAAADLLHKLAGTAGMFGEVALGDRASEMEEGLLAWPPAERADRATEAAVLLRAAA